MVPPMSAIEDIQRERDAMLARSRRGIQRDDEKTPEDWAASLLKIVREEPAQRDAFRHMWVKVGAVALRAIESIDRKTAGRSSSGVTTYEKTRADLAEHGVHMPPLGGWPHQHEDAQESDK